MNGRSSATLIFIILIPKFNNQVNQLLTHMGTCCRPNVTSLLWVTLLFLLLRLIIPIFLFFDHSYYLAPCPYMGLCEGPCKSYNLNPFINSLNIYGVL